MLTHFTCRFTFAKLELIVRVDCVERETTADVYYDGILKSRDDPWEYSDTNTPDNVEVEVYRPIHHYGSMLEWLESRHGQFRPIAA